MLRFRRIRRDDRSGRISSCSTANDDDVTRIFIAVLCISSVHDEPVSNDAGRHERLDSTNTVGSADCLWSEHLHASNRLHGSERLHGPAANPTTSHAAICSPYECSIRNGHGLSTACNAELLCGDHANASVRHADGDDANDEHASCSGISNVSGNGLRHSDLLCSDVLKSGLWLDANADRMVSGSDDIQPNDDAIVSHSDEPDDDE